MHYPGATIRMSLHFKRSEEWYDYDRELAVALCVTGERSDKPLVRMGVAVKCPVRVNGAYEHYHDAVMRRFYRYIGAS